MNALIDLENRLGALIPPDKHDAFDKVIKEWTERWVLAAENMVRVRKDQLDIHSAARVKSIADRMKDTLFTALGRDRSLLFTQVRAVGDLYEFRLAFSVLRPLPVEPETAAPPAAGNGAPDGSPGEG